MRTAQFSKWNAQVRRRPRAIQRDCDGGASVPQLRGRGCWAAPSYDHRMSGLRIGPGELGGNAVYAAREFAAGEVVIAFDLQPLTREQFLELTSDEQLFVHSYGGRRWLYPPPARWVNHADQPSCYQDFERGCDVALRPINIGEPITIDARTETDRELSTFLEVYLATQQALDEEELRKLVSEDAVLWDRGRVQRGGEQVASALVAAPTSSFTSVEWQVATGRWEALCSVEQSDEHLSLFLRVLEGNWQLVYAHRG